MGCVDGLLLCLSFILSNCRCVLSSSEVKNTSEFGFYKHVLFFLLCFSLSLLLPSPHPCPPLPPLTCLACPAIAPLLCGLSFVSPAGYSFVPPSSTPFWSGTGITSLSLSSFLSLSFLSLSLCFHVGSCLACWLQLCAISSPPQSLPLHLTSTFTSHHFTSYIVLCT